MLDIRLAVSDPSQRVNLLNEIAALREAIGQKPQAFTARLRSFSENPYEPSGREALERVAADLGAFEELAGAYEDQLERDADEELSEDLWRRLAILYGDRLIASDYGKTVRMTEVWDAVSMQVWTDDTLVVNDPNPYGSLLPYVIFPNVRTRAIPAPMLKLFGPHNGGNAGGIPAPSTA